MILDEVVRKENIQLDNDLLDAEFNETLNSLAQQGMDFSKIRGGKKGQKQLSEAIAMESASRVMTRKALDTLKLIATGEYKPAESEAGEEAAAVEVVEEKKPKAKKKAKKVEVDPEVSENVSSSSEEKAE